MNQERLASRDRRIARLIGISGEHGEVIAVRFTRQAGHLVTVRKELAPSKRDLIIGPLPGDVGAIAEHDV
jgi:hypothetical protein